MDSKEIEMPFGYYCDSQAAYDHLAKVFDNLMADWLVEEDEAKSVELEERCAEILNVRNQWRNNHED